MDADEAVVIFAVHMDAQLTICATERNAWDLNQKHYPLDSIGKKRRGRSYVKHMPVSNHQDSFLPFAHFIYLYDGGREQYKL